MNSFAQNGIVEHPSPILVGNVGFDDPHSYNYISAYIVLDGTNKNLIYYDFYQNSWVLNSVNNAYDIFPRYANSYRMNGFVNDQSGHPQFITNTDSRLFYNDDEWTIANYVGPNYEGVGKRIKITINDLSDANDVPHHIVSGWSDFNPGTFNNERFLTLTSGNIKSLNTPISFETKFTQEGEFAPIPTAYISGYMQYNSTYCKKMPSSPPVLSGPPCLGFYSNGNNTYAIGSVVLGNNNLKLIGTNHLGMDTKYRYPSITPLHYNYSFDEYINEAYWWIGISIDQNEDVYYLNKILTNTWHYDEEGQETVYKKNNLILTKNETNPFRAQHLWVCEWNPQGYDVNNASPFSPLLSGVLHFEAFPSGNDIDLQVIGMCDKDANFIKSGHLTNQILYVGNWVSPQITFENKEPNDD